MNEKLLNALIDGTKISTEEFDNILNVDATAQKAIQKLVDEKVNNVLQTAIGLNQNDEEQITAMIEVTVKPEGGTGFDKTAHKISKYPEVKSVFLMSGGNDLTIIIEANSLRQISQFVSEKLSTLGLVNSTNTKLVLKKYKENGEVFIVNDDNDERLIISI